MLSSRLAAFAAISLMIGSSAASAQISPTAQPTTTAANVQRATAPVPDSNELRGTTGWILGAIAVGLLIWGALELFGDDEDDAPVSP
jgi:hypothetical protein